MLVGSIVVELVGKGIEVLVETMTSHLQARHVQECAVAALSNLSASSPDNQTKIAEADGINALLAAMNAHRLSRRLHLVRLLDRFTPNFVPDALLPHNAARMAEHRWTRLG